MEVGMRRLMMVLGILSLSGAAFAEVGKDVYTIPELIEYALRNNPGLTAAGMDIDAERYRIEMAKGEKMPKVDFRGGVTRYRYDTPITPISGSPLAGSPFPEFDNNIYDAGVSVTIPLYMGGRLERGVTISEIKKAVAEDAFQMSRQELIYNVTAVSYKVLQLERLLEVSEAAVKQLEAHRKNAELFLQAGTVPRVELLRAEVELAHAGQNAVNVGNSLESTYEMLKTLMGVEDPDTRFVIMHETEQEDKYPVIVEEGISRALVHRPDYLSVLKKKKMAEETVRLTEGKGLPSVYMSGEYSERSGDDIEFKENWNLGLRLSVPIFEGGIIRAEAKRERMRIDRAKEEERSVKLQIMREVKDSYLNIENAQKRKDVSEKALEAARETLRIEVLRFETGAGTSTEVIDAQTGLLRAETEYQQAVFDKKTAIAALRRAMGEDVFQQSDGGERDE